jgi:hypothetical protein
MHGQQNIKKPTKTAVYDNLTYILLVNAFNLLSRYKKFRAFDNILALHYGQFLYSRMKSKYKHATHVLREMHYLSQFRERLMYLRTLEIDMADMSS